jgi:dTDP-4-dehydrorhamnose reductase
MRLYLTGGTGLVGSNVIKIAQERYTQDIVASLFGPPPEVPIKYELDPLDMSDQNAILASIRKFKPDVVIHSAALLDQEMIHKKRKLAWEIMVGGTMAFARACREVGARFIFISSDWTFDGREPLIDEDSPPFPVNFYGVMKMAAERELVSTEGLNFAVARLAGVYGLNYAMPSMTRWVQGVGFGDLPNYVVDRITKGQVAGIWMTDVNDTSHATLASDAADMLMRLAQYDGTGIFHCFGSEAISRLDLAHKVVDVFGADHGLIAAIPTDPIVAAQHADIRIPFRFVASTEKTAQALGRKAFNVVEGLEAFKREMEAI